MQIESTAIHDVKIVMPKKHGDSRGFFSETYNRRAMAELGLDLDEFVQDNHSLSAERHVLRGLHFQIPPHAQAKLVRVVRGAILDVVVDIRRRSPTFGQHVAVVLSAENWKQIYVPKAFAHGFATLEPNTEVIYKVTDYYAPECDRGLLWNDPELAIDWGEAARAPILSDRDKKHPRLADAGDLF